MEEVPESIEKKVENITLQHITTIDGLYKILIGIHGNVKSITKEPEEMTSEPGMSSTETELFRLETGLVTPTPGLVSPKILFNIGLLTKQKPEPEAIFFSPLYLKNELHPFLYEEDYIDTQGIILVDFKSAIERYPSFFINDDNNFVPMSGMPKKTKTGETCKCRYTYNQNLDVLKKEDDTPKYNFTKENGEMNECMKSFPEMIEHISRIDPAVNFEHCGDGGMEVGFITNLFELEGLLRWVILPDRDKIKKLKTFVKRFETMAGSVDNVYNTIEEITHRLGGVFIEGDYNREGTGKSKIRHRKSKKITRKRKNKRKTLRKRRFRRINN